MVDGKKRAAGREPADFLKTYGCLPLRRDPNYGEYVSLLLNTERVRIENIVDISEGVAIGRGDRRIPNDWIDAMTDDPVERAKWKAREWKREAKR